MPSTMIHLLTAYKTEPGAADLFWVGNFAPDYTNDRDLKDKIHLRDIACRWDALLKLKGELDLTCPFERGWILHLFTDACWDEKYLPAYKEFFESSNTEGHWFHSYRHEIGLASYYLYHNLPWTAEVHNSILTADLGKLKTTLPVSIEGVELYRDRVMRKHAESSRLSVPVFFTSDITEKFAEYVSEKYLKWLKA